MLNLEVLLAAFGGGLFGAAIGALPAFIFAGIMGLIGISILSCGGTVDILGQVAFGTLFGPHIAFAGGVAAAAYAANKKKLLGVGTDLSSPLMKTRDNTVLIVGGLFGVIGYLINYFYSVVLALQTDTVAMTVFTSGLIARLIFGSTGIFGKYEAKVEGNSGGAHGSVIEKRRFIPDCKSLSLTIVLSLGVGLVISYITDSTQIVNLGFCISAASLLFAQMGFEIPTTHHITMVAGYATIATGSIFIGALFAILSGVLCEIAGMVFNSYNDSHIDPPATAIFILSFVIFVFM
ncbi:MAG: hypothetical protein N4A57_12880 [Anaeromicrobium sp.]|jgi:hypothetical protein|uniref:hypothetical protein n=1 Tax=Anaeromicrobium sp. TaxID=1929132 RepID=UPI0025F0AC28|nr:hypothetical protein [Anaeromicrobium sp.]MCT4595145.1 hypothetical protein [Anaeromicrobium sp.]